MLVVLVVVGCYILFSVLVLSGVLEEENSQGHHPGFWDVLAILFFWPHGLGMVISRVLNAPVDAKKSREGDDAGIQ